MSIQQSLTAFVDPDWSLVDERVEGEEYWCCPDCRQPLIAGFWPAKDDDIDGILGDACPRCRLIVPDGPENAEWSPYDVATVTLRSGETARICVWQTAPEYIELTNTTLDHDSLPEATAP